MTEVKPVPLKADFSDVCGDEKERKAIARFLASQEGGVSVEAFLKEAACWWDSNPAQGGSDPKGWVLRHEGAVVGFLGVFVCEYRYGDKRLKGLAASSWFVDERFRKQSLQLFNSFFACRNEYVLLNTTPSPVVQAVLQMYKFQSVERFDRVFFLFRQSMFGRFGWLNLLGVKTNGVLPSTSRQYETSLDGVSTNVCSLPADVIVKDNSVKALRWAVDSKAASPKYLAAFRCNGALTAYVVLRPDSVRGFRGLSCVECGWQSRQEFLELLSSLCRNPEPLQLPFTPCFLTLNLFDHQRDMLGVDFSKGVLRTGSVPHYYHLPDSLADASKLCMLAEGDYGRFG